jgi:peptide chain release factor subunit 1
MEAIVNQSSSESVRSRRKPPTNGRRENGRAAAGPLAGLLSRLTQLRPGEDRVVTCYLKLEPRDRVRGKYLVKFKNRMRETLQGLSRLGMEKETEEAVRRDIGRIHDYLRDVANLPASHGLAIFACEGRKLFEAQPLPLVYRSRLAVDQTALVKELASAEDEFGRLLTAVLDRTSARFFEITAYDARELAGLRSDATRGRRFHSSRDGSSGWGEHTYHNRIRTEKQRHLEAVARELFSIDRREPTHGIVLAGTGTDAGAVRPFLHSYLEDRLIGTVKLNPKEATPASVHAATLAVREHYERESERMVVAEMDEAIGTGWAVNGIPATLRALSRGQVRALLVHADASAPGFRCADSGRLALLERDCRGEGAPLPVIDVVDDAIEEALRQHVDVNVVYEEEACERIDGLAALLRFR